MYDNAPLVKTRSSPPSPDPNPVYTPSLPNQLSDPSSRSLINIVLNSADLSFFVEGSQAIITLDLENIGTVTLSPSAQIVLVPINKSAIPIGILPASYDSGKYLINFGVQIPSSPGTYTSTFQPEMITTDPSGNEVLMNAGGLVTFIVTVNPDGTVNCTLGS
jgi:hypothetical protein